MESDEGLQLGCPVCWHDFDDGRCTPYVLWCGHSLCRNCVLELDPAMLKLVPFLPLRLPLFISCPWCQFLTLRMLWKGTLRYPRKNFFLLWIVESIRAGNSIFPAASGSEVLEQEDEDQQQQKQQISFPCPIDLSQGTQVDPATAVLGSMSAPRNLTRRGRQHQPQPMDQRRRPPVSSSSFILEALHDWWWEMYGSWSWNEWQRSAARVAAFFIQVTTKLPLVCLLFFIICYVVPFSIFILTIYFLLTVVFAVPSFLAIYFSFPSCDWLFREISEY